MNRLQISSFLFIPAILTSIVGAARGVRLRFTHIFIAPLFATSFVNHSRDFYEGPNFDIVDTTDRVAVVFLTLACLLDALTLKKFQIFLAAFFALFSFFFYLYSLSLKNVVLKGAAPQKIKNVEFEINAEIVRTWMHACAALSVFILLLSF